MSALEVEDLSVRYGTGRRTMTAVDAVSLSIPDGGMLGLVGESGSGKSTLGRAIAGLVPAARGRVLVGGRQITGRAHRSPAGRNVQMIFQDPYGSLDPRMTIGESIAEGVTAGARHGRRERAAEVRRLLDLVSLDPQQASALPARLSGGQRQRVAVARALAARPAVLVADEITSALDVSVQGSVLTVVQEAVRAEKITTLFISHNLAVVSAMCDQIAVMYAGSIIEQAPAAQLISRPRHPYTRALLDAVPVVNQPAPGEMATTLDVEPPDPHDPPAGCRFHPRCPVGPSVHPERTVCIEAAPAFSEAGPHHLASCHFPLGQPLPGRTEPNA
jgi:peptide/nickel transport system ATP-binding protein